jgi:hypothetical protein
VPQVRYAYVWTYRPQQAYRRPVLAYRLVLEYCQRHSSIPYYYLSTILLLFQPSTVLPYLLQFRMAAVLRFTAAPWKYGGTVTSCRSMNILTRILRLRVLIAVDMLRSKRAWLCKCIKYNLWTWIHVFKYAQ